MKKILVFGLTHNPGGVESVIMNYYRNVDKTKLHFDFLVNQKEVAYEDEILRLGGNILKITPRRKNPFKFYKECKQIFKNCRYDAIWVNVCNLANITYLKLAKKYGVKIRIIHSHNSKNMDSFVRGLMHNFNKLLIEKYATHFWACSELAGKYFYPNKILNSKNYRVINNAIDLQKFQFNQSTRDQTRKELNVTNNFVVGHVGRLHFQKNQEFLIKIFYEIKKQNNSAILLLVGQGEDKQKLENLINQLNLTDSIKFLGVRNDIDKLLQAFDVMPFPSLFEGLPVILVEAQASGLPIYAADTVSPDTKINDNFTFCSLDDPPKVWANKILTEKSKPRKCDLENFKKHGYDIKTETLKFEKIIIGE